MKPIFDGVCINQILLQADTVNRVAPIRGASFCSSSPWRKKPRPGALNDLLNRVKKRGGSIFIRRFLMKHFKCMEFTVVPPRRTVPGHTHPFVWISLSPLSLFLSLLSTRARARERVLILFQPVLISTDLARH